MEKLSMCRICLIEDVRMYYLSNTNLKETYGKLTGKLFETKEVRPLQVCYICFARLRNCYQLRASCLHSEEVFTQMLEKENIQFKAMKYKKRLQITCTPVLHFSVGLTTPKDPDDEVQKHDTLSTASFALTCDVQLKIEDLQGNDITHQEVDTKSMVSEDVVDNLNKDSQVNVLEYSIQTIKTEDNSAPESSELNINDVIEKNYSEDPMIEYNIQIIKTEDNSAPDSSELIIDNVIDKNYSEDNLFQYSIQTIKKEDYSAPEFSELSIDDIVKSSESQYIFLKSIPVLKTQNSGELEEDSQGINLLKPQIKSIPEHNYHTIKPNIVQSTRKSHEFLSNSSEQYNKSKGNKSFTAGKHHKCDICGKAFKEQCTLLKHVFVHNGLKSYECDVCGEYFRRRYALTTHIRIHTGVKAYKCDICNKHFIQKVGLKTHMRVHTGEKPFICRTCGKSFNAKGNLTIHIRRHSGEKPHKCDICNKSFIQKDELLKHVRKHSGEKPYKCNICGKYFSQQGSLTGHIRSHTNERPFKCLTCGKHFKRSSHLASHASVHNKNLL